MVRQKITGVSSHTDANYREGMQKLSGTGKVRNISVSNFGIKNLEHLLSAPTIKIVPAVNQIELLPKNPSPKLVEYNASRGSTAPDTLALARTTHLSTKTHAAQDGREEGKNSAAASACLGSAERMECHSLVYKQGAH